MNLMNILYFNFKNMKKLINLSLIIVTLLTTWNCSKEDTKFIESSDINSEFTFTAKNTLTKTSLDTDDSDINTPRKILWSANDQISVWDRGNIVEQQAPYSPLNISSGIGTSSATFTIGDTGLNDTSLEKYISDEWNRTITSDLSEWTDGSRIFDALYPYCDNCSYYENHKPLQWDLYQKQRDNNGDEFWYNFTSRIEYYKRIYCLVPVWQEQLNNDNTDLICPYMTMIAETSLDSKPADNNIEFTFEPLTAMLELELNFTSSCPFDVIKKIKLSTENTSTDNTDARIARILYYNFETASFVEPESESGENITQKYDKEYADNHESVNPNEIVLQVYSDQNNKDEGLAIIKDETIPMRFYMVLAPAEITSYTITIEFEDGDELEETYTNSSEEAFTFERGGLYKKTIDLTHLGEKR